MGKAGYNKFNVFRNASYDTLAILRDKDNPTISLLQELSDFRMYIDAVDPNYASVMLMTAATWETIDIMTLRMNHVNISTAISTTPKPSINATTVTLSNMETTDFLKYISVVLTDKKPTSIFL